MIIDAHLHCSGKETVGEVLRSLDTAGVDIGVLLAPFLTEPYSMHEAASLEAANRYLSALVKGNEDRLVGFAVLNPLHPKAPDALERAVMDLGLRGLKMVPSGWYPFDDCAHRVYEMAEKLGVPVLFHSGIFIDGRSGRYCRPTYFEAVRDHPGLKVTLAHLSWPWCDEAIAVGVIDLINGIAPQDSQFRFDISFGPPPVYRNEVLHKALEVLGPQMLQFGSDRFLPCSGEHIRSAIEEVMALLDSLGVGEEDQASIFAGTAASWLGLEMASPGAKEEKKNVATQ